MAFSTDNLALMAGSNSTSGKIWKYKEAQTLATLRGSGYFDNSVDSSVTDEDIIWLIGSDGFGMSQVTVTGAVYTLGEDITSA